MSSNKSKCVEQTTKRYTDRPSPPYIAEDCKKQTMEGNDRRQYVSAMNQDTGKWRWVLVDGVNNTLKTKATKSPNASPKAAKAQASPKAAKASRSRSQSRSPNATPGRCPAGTIRNSKGVCVDVTTAAGKKLVAAKKLADAERKAEREAKSSPTPSAKPRGRQPKNASPAPTPSAKPRGRPRKSSATSLVEMTLKGSPRLRARANTQTKASCKEMEGDMVYNPASGRCVERGGVTALRNNLK
jgi:hypothetical protein